jgi:hypothetical protein
MVGGKGAAEGKGAGMHVWACGEYIFHHHRVEINVGHPLFPRNRASSLAFFHDYYYGTILPTITILVNGPSTMSERIASKD